MDADDIRYDALPEHMRGAARRWVEEGILPGEFLQAVICNDLFEAFGRADEINTAAMPIWVSWFYNEAPSACFGSPEKMAKWAAQGRLMGLRRKSVTPVREET